MYKYFNVILRISDLEGDYGGFYTFEIHIMT